MPPQVSFVCLVCLAYNSLINDQRREARTVVMSVIVSSLQSEIDELKARIDKTRMHLIKEEAVLEYLVAKTKKASDVADKQHVFSAVSAAKDTQGVIDLSKFAVSKTVNNFPNDVWNIVSQFGDQEFTAPLVHDVMSASGFTVAGKSPKARISVELAKLVEDQKLVRTFEGKGSTPNRYSLSKTGEGPANVVAGNGNGGAFNLQPSPNKGH